MQNLCRKEKESKIFCNIAFLMTSPYILQCILLVLVLVALATVHRQEEHDQRSTIKETLRACVRKVGAFRNLLVEVTTGTEERTGRYEYHTRRVLPLTLVAMMDWILPHDALYCTLY